SENEFASGVMGLGGPQLSLSKDGSRITLSQSARTKGPGPKSLEFFTVWDGKTGAVLPRPEFQGGWDMYCHPQISPDGSTVALFKRTARPNPEAKENDLLEM